MAMREVVIDETGPKNFFKFQAIGDTLAGFYVGKSTDKDKYGKTQYTFRDPQGVDHTVSATYDLERRLEKAIEDGLKKGNKVLMKYSSDLPTGQDSPMKMYTVKWDDTVFPLPEPKKAAPKDDIDF